MQYCYLNGVINIQQMFRAKTEKKNGFEKGFRESLNSSNCLTSRDYQF